MPLPPSPQKWTILQEEAGPEIPIFKLFHQWVSNPRNGLTFKRLKMTTHDWVNVVALTPAQEIILVEQYRFGAEKITLEIPGGTIDAGETPAAAAARELLEETGYASSKWVYLGAVDVNPAIQNNRCHHFLAEGANQIATPAFDAGEDIVIRQYSQEQLRQAIQQEILTHSLALSGLSRVFDLRAVLVPRRSA